MYIKNARFCIKFETISRYFFLPFCHRFTWEAKRMKILYQYASLLKKKRTEEITDSLESIRSWLDALPKLRITRFYVWFFRFSFSFYHRLRCIFSIPTWLNPRIISTSEPLFETPYFQVIRSLCKEIPNSRITSWESRSLGELSCYRAISPYLEIYFSISTKAQSSTLFKSISKYWSSQIEFPANPRQKFPNKFT